MKDKNEESLNTIERLVEGLPDEDRKEAVATLATLRASLSRRKRILSIVQDALQQLRLDMKYLVFDLECTRRERDTLRAQQDPEF